jgi:hypothetical protein
MTSTAKKVKLHMHTAFHNTEKKKVLFALSFINGGVAASWKQEKTAAFLKSRKFGAFDTFKYEITTAFSSIDDKGVAKTEFQTLHQGKKQIEEYIMQFTIIAAQTGLTKDMALIKYFINGLNPKLMKYIYTMEKPSTTLKG